MINKIILLKTTVQNNTYKRAVIPQNMIQIMITKYGVS